MAMEPTQNEVPARPQARLQTRAEKLALKAEADRQMREKTLNQQAVAMKEIQATRSRVNPAFIGVRVRVKTARGDKPRPTTVAFRSLDGIIRTYELNSEQDEMDFASGVFPTRWRLVTDAEISQFLAYMTAAENALTAPPPFLPWQVKRDLKRKDLKAYLTPEALKQLPAGQKIFAVVPTDYDGFRPDLGDEVLIPHGGEGNYLAYAMYRMIPEAERESQKSAVRRISTSRLKQQRDRENQPKATEAEPVAADAPKKRGRKPKKATQSTAMERKEQDHILLTTILADKGVVAELQMMTPADLRLIEVTTAFKRWQLLQEDRKKAEQHATINRRNLAYLQCGYGDPLVNIEAVTGDTSDDYVDIIHKAEDDAKKQMERLLLTLPAYRDVLKTFPGIGASIGGRIIVSIGDINRFRKDGWHPEEEIKELEATIGGRFVELGLKEMLGGPTLQSALEEGLSVPLADLEEGSELFHHRLHLIHSEKDGEKAGKPDTFRLLNVLADKWTREAQNPAKAALANDTIRLMKRKYGIAKRLRKSNVEEMRLQKMIKSVQRYLGVFVNTFAYNSEGKCIGSLPPDAWHFGRRQRGVVGGWDPKGRQAFHLIADQANKDCDTKLKVYGPLRKALSYLLFEYYRRHPEEVTVTRGDKTQVKFNAFHRLHAARWQFCSRLIEWIVRSWMELNATGKVTQEPFIFGVIRDAEAKYPEGVLRRACEMKTVTKADLAWQPGDPPPPEPTEPSSDDEDEEPAMAEA